MKVGRSAPGGGVTLIVMAVLLAGVAVSLLPPSARTQGPADPKAILVLYWYNKDYPANVVFDQSFQARLKSAPAGTVEYYCEYLETDRFPGEDQAVVLRDYLRRKYAHRSISVVVGAGDPVLNFLIKYRDDLFPTAPIVFGASLSPPANELEAGPGMTGLIVHHTHGETLDLALRLHPNTEQVFVVSGTLEHDKRYERAARERLQGYENKVAITYLTDLTPGELTSKMKALPEHSIVLYIWQQAHNEEGKLLETPDILSLITASTTAPIYGLAGWQVGRGIVGGYVRSTESSASRMAELALRIANGERAQDIPVELTPVEPMFDWYELQRRGIDKDLLPLGSIIKNRASTLWDQYKWYAIGVIFVFVVQSTLIVALVINRTRRKRAEEARRKSDERFRALVTASSDVVYRMSADWKEMLYLNGRAFLPDTRDATVAWLEKYIPPDNRPQVEAVIHEAIRARSIFELEHQVIRVDGTLGWTFSRAVPLLDAEGEIVEWFGAATDITERRQAEEALRESEERFRNMANNAPVMVWVTEPDGSCSFLSQSWYDFTGQTPETGLGFGWLNATHPGDQQYAYETFLAANERREAFHLEYRLRRKDGSYAWAIDAAAPRFSDGGEFLGYIGSVIDITERKHAEEALRESEERFRNMADTAPVMIWVSGPDRLHTYFNNQWLDFTGHSIEQELGNGWAECIYPDDYEYCCQTYNSAFDRREPFTMEYRLRRADGQFRWVFSSGTTRFSPGGEFLGYIGSCIDITERKAAEQALMDLSGQLIQAREDERARIARELHDDFSQSVALISMELDQLSQILPQSEIKLHAAVREVIEQAAGLSTEIHRMSHDLHPFKLTHLGLVATLKSLCAELSGSYGLRIEFRHSDVPATLPKEVSLCLYRIVQESLNNVVRHSGAKEAQVELRGTGQEIHLRVTDSGKGFDAESARSKNGLGLISMRERLRLVGGKISIDSRISSGTGVDVRVPLGAAKAGHKSAAE